MLSIQIKYSLVVLAELAKADSRGERPTITEMKHRGGLDNNRVVSEVMLSLKRADIVGFIGNRYFLARELRSISLYDLGEAVEYDFFLRESRLNEGWSSSAQYVHIRTITLDTKLTVELRELLRNIPLDTLLPDCKEIATSRTRPTERALQPEKPILSARQPLDWMG